ncbi:MAG: hypothetical protein JRF72_04830 [Deltaproteobacteria bacterium]|jgi:hypothetical protein|nr:hypothetical protein [Deltaproteobacteria bacterium]
MAEEGFKRKLTAILSADFKYYSRRIPGTEGPMRQKLTHFSTYKAGTGRQYRLPEFYWTNGCDDRNYLISSNLKFITKKGE